MSNKDISSFGLTFSQLPIDLLPCILAPIENPSHLAHCALVSKAFHAATVPLLYRHIAIYPWTSQWKHKIFSLFHVLKTSPSLARYVRKLVMKDFPKGQMIFPQIGQDIISLTVAALQNCVNLVSCTWTRHGALHRSILHTLASLPFLVDLEINAAQSDGDFIPSQLLSFSHLTRLSLIMPTRLVVAELPQWLQLTGQTLRSFHIICKASPFIHDELLESLSPHLSNLEQFYLTNCPKVTEQGILSILSRSANSIRGLGLEGLSPRFDLEKFAGSCSSMDLLIRLHSITLTVNDPQSSLWPTQMSKLLSSSPSLEYFHIYSLTDTINPNVPSPLWKSIVDAHGPNLLRFSVHRIPMELDSIRYVTEGCPNLRELFIVVQPVTMATLGMLLSPLQNLKTLHINFAFRHPSIDPQQVNPDDMMKEIIAYTPMSLRLIGINTRVWQVERELTPSGEWRRTPMRYRGTEIPEPFLVVRA